jgi:hypothetical protein
MSKNNWIYLISIFNASVVVEQGENMIAYFRRLIKHIDALKKK